MGTPIGIIILRRNSFMALVNFKKGLAANLPSTKSEGTIYITTDERALYLDVDSSTRIRLGDFIEVANISALPASGASTTALYYAAAENVLAKWSGSAWVQINPDTKYTFSTPTESGYTQGYVKIVSNVSGADPVYVKVSGLGDAAYTTVSTLEGTMDTKVATLANGAVATNTAAISAINNTTTGILAQAKSYADGLDTAMDTRMDAVEAELNTATTGLKARMTTAESDIDALETKVGSTAVATQISTAIAAEDTLAQGYASAAETAAKGYTDALEAELADVAKSGTAADVIVDNAGITATNLDAALTELLAAIGAGGTGSVVTCEKDTTQTGIAARYTFKQGGTAIANAVIDIPKDMVVESGSVVTNPAGKPAGTYLKLVLANATEDEIYINVSSLIEYVTSGSQTGDMVMIAIDSDHKVTASITDGTVTLAKLASAVQAEINKAHTHTNGTVLDGITSTKVSAWDAAEQNAKDYADGLDEAMDARMDDVEASITAIKDGTSIDSFGDVETALGNKVDKVSGSSLVADTKVAAYDAHIADSDIHVTSTLKASWNAKQDALVFNTAYSATTNKVATMADVSDASLTWGSF